uniref:PDZ domain-containing protein n=1 Tax=Rhabditophanes sp. KR3021 TaxID=114890 RepID=A0AC35TYD4_9BILA
MDVFGFPYYINHLQRDVTYQDPRQQPSEICLEEEGRVGSGASYPNLPNITIDQHYDIHHTSHSSPDLSDAIRKASTDFDRKLVSRGEDMASNDDSIISSTVGALTIPTPEEMRTVSVVRDNEIGFGFVAASQMPVIIQYVTPAGPSDGKLMANDQICFVNDLDVRELTKEEVVTMIRNEPHQITLTVQQLTQRPRSSRRNLRVRFTDKIHVSNMRSPAVSDSLPNVLRVFMENGQTKSFRYDETTVVRDLVLIICEKLLIKQPDRFVLCLENSLSLRASKISLLRSDMKISDLSNCAFITYTRCRFRIAFMPLDTFIFQLEDEHGFEYLYQQCINDIVSGRFSFEMRYEACMRLAALHLRQLAYENHQLGHISSLSQDCHVSLSTMAREYGLATFMPMLLLENIKIKQIRKHLRFYLNRDEGRKTKQKISLVGGCTSGELRKNSLQEDSDSSFSVIQEDSGNVSLNCKLKYVQIVSLLPSFGGKTYNVTFKQTSTDMILQIDHAQGILIRQPGNMNQPTISVSFDLVESIVITPQTEILRLIFIELKNNCHPGLQFSIDKSDVDDLAYYIQGYAHVTFQKEISCKYAESVEVANMPNYGPPNYRSVHIVLPSDWNYAPECKENAKMMVNLSTEPPDYDQAIKATTHYYNEADSEDEAANLRDINTERSTDPLLDQENGRIASPTRYSETETFSSGNLDEKVPRNFNLRLNDSIKINKKRHSIVSTHVDIVSHIESNPEAVCSSSRRPSTISMNLQNIDTITNHFSNQVTSGSSQFLNSNSHINENGVGPSKNLVTSGGSNVRRTSLSAYSIGMKT